MEFVYSAAGVKLRKIVREAGKSDATTDYSGGFVYQNDTLQFVHTAEGRVLYRPQDHTRSWAYEYHYKDHLGNTRLAFRKQEHEVKVATLEPSRIADEQHDFDNIIETRSPDRSYNGNYSSRLSAAENKPLGPVTMLSVQRGDSLTLSAFASYQENALAGKTWALAAFVSSLFNSTAPPAPGTEGYRSGKYTPYIGLALGASIVALQTEEGVPNAYLKYIVLDQDSQYVYSDVQVISSAAGQTWQEVKLHYKAEQDGFVQVFVYNESGQEVFFDDITIRKDPALIVQENHYDPWGMNLVGIEKQGRPDHKFQYNGKEKQEEFGLHWNDYGVRFYDPQLARWHAVDPLAGLYFNESPYNYVHNSPLLFIDPTGMAAVYNWDTGKYIDGDTEVSWDKVQKQYGIGQDDDKNQVKGAKVVVNTPGTGIRKKGNNYEIFNTAEARGDANDANTISEISIGLSPAGTGLDFYTLATGEEFFSGEKVAWHWRLGGLLPLVSELRKGVKVYKAANKSLKATLPAWKSIGIDMEHIASGHMVEGSRVSKLKTIFPEGMNPNQVERTVRSAYQNVTDKLLTQGDRTLLRGVSSSGLQVEMWLNKSTKTIETAYPVK
jgi:RHS repeat-associated protein